MSAYNDSILIAQCTFHENFKGRSETKNCQSKFHVRTLYIKQNLFLLHRRRGTMQKFLDLVEADGYFRHEVSERVTEEIQNILETKIQSDQMYEADLHQSILIRLWPNSS